MVTHDPHAAASGARRILHLDKGRLVEANGLAEAGLDGTTDVMERTEAYRAATPEDRRALAGTSS